MIQPIFRLANSSDDNRVFEWKLSMVSDSCVALTVIDQSGKSWNVGRFTRDGFLRDSSCKCGAFATDDAGRIIVAK